MSYEIQFHELACFSVHCDGLVLVFDPHDGVSMKLAVPEIRNADIVLCTHSHYDHNNGKVLVKGVNALVLDYQEGDFEFQGVQIHGTRVKHGGYPQWGDNIIYSVRFPSGPIFIHGGDMGCVPNPNELLSILCLGQPDVIFLPIGDYYSIGAKEAIETATLLNPKKTTVVCHYLYGPLLVKEDFQGMTTEAPFHELERSNLEIISDRLSSNQNYKKYVLFEPKSRLS